MTDQLASEFSAVYATLRADVDAYCKPIDDSSNQSYLYSDPVKLTQLERRAVVRAVFAFAEATTYLLRQQLLADFEGLLAIDTLLALKEQQISVTNAGQVRTTTLRVGSLGYIRLTFNVYREVFPQSGTPLCEGSDFEALAAAVKVRDRLMHPRSAENLSVTDDEIRKAMRGFFWLNDSTQQVLQAHVARLRQR